MLTRLSLSCPINGIFERFITSQVVAVEIFHLCLGRRPVVRSTLHALCVYGGTSVDLANEEMFWHLT